MTDKKSDACRQRKNIVTIVGTYGDHERPNAGACMD